MKARFCRIPGLIAYDQAFSVQQQLHAARVADEIPDTLLLLQHPPVITLGRRGRREHLLVEASRLEAGGIQVVQASRGGDVTYHGPGQWVLYPILKLSRNELGTHGYLHALEEIAIRCAADAGFDAFRREGKAGAWCEQGKFAAIGFQFKRWVSLHGMSLNVHPNLSHFDFINGCGLVGEAVCSFRSVLEEACPEMEEVAQALQGHCEQVLARELELMSPKQLPGL